MGPPIRLARSRWAAPLLKQLVYLGDRSFFTGDWIVETRASNLGRSSRPSLAYAPMRARRGDGVARQPPRGPSWPPAGPLRSTVSFLAPLWGLPAGGREGHGRPACRQARGPPAGPRLPAPA
eukprot:11542125-Alexandrium_andersonii.AAC.1